MSCDNSGGTGCTGKFTRGPNAGTLNAVAIDGYTFKGWFSNLAKGEFFSTCGKAKACVNFAKSESNEYVVAVFERSHAVHPLLLYTDILFGPTAGGENDHGIYLSVFGKNFGSGQLGKTVKVYINNVEVAAYLNPGRIPVASRGRQDIQQISTQVGALGGARNGTVLPIKVAVDGRVSNPDQVSAPDPTFTVNAGEIYFVDNVNGVDTPDTTTGGSFARPFRTVQRPEARTLRFALEPASLGGAWGRVQAGDFIVMRGTGIPWTDRGLLEMHFLRTYNKSGCPVGTNCAQGGGTRSGPITLMGYPGEDVLIDIAYDATKFTGSISSANSNGQQNGMGAWITIANLRIEGGGEDGVINTQNGCLNPNGGNWRVVNNELTAATAVANAKALAGGIVGCGLGHIWLGNHIHDIYQGPDKSTTPKQNHGVYIGGAGTYEVAYNRIEHIRGGNGIQTYANGGGALAIVNNVRFHHNVVKNTGKHGINISIGTTDNIWIWNNVISDTDQSGIRLASDQLRTVKIYNNTVYNIDALNNYNKFAAALANDGTLPAGASVDIRNNIFVPGHSRRRYIGGEVGLGQQNSIIAHNLWFGGLGPVPASNNVISDPLFVNAAAYNFRLQLRSPAIGAGASAAPITALVLDDYDLANGATTQIVRTIPYDIGAYRSSVARILVQSRRVTQIEER